MTAPNIDPGPLTKLWWKGVDITATLIGNLLTLAVGTYVFTRWKENLEAQIDRRIAFRSKLNQRRATWEQMSYEYAVLIVRLENVLSIEQPEDYDLENTLREINRDVHQFLRKYLLIDSLLGNSDFQNGWFQLSFVADPTSAFDRDEVQKALRLMDTLRLPNEVKDEEYPWEQVPVAIPRIPKVLYPKPKAGRGSHQ